MIHILESNTVQALRHETHSASVKRGIHEFQFRMTLAGFRGKHEGENVGKILLVHVLAHHLDGSAFLLCLETHLGRIRNLGNLGYYILVHRRCNLRSVRPEHLVSVVFLRIVGSRHHDSGNGPLEPDGIAEFRCRPDVVEKEDMHPVCAHDICSNLGEKLAVVPAVE